MQGLVSAAADCKVLAEHEYQGGGGLGCALSVFNVAGLAAQFATMPWRERRLLKNIPMNAITRPFSVQVRAAQSLASSAGDRSWAATPSTACVFPASRPPPVRPRPRSRRPRHAPAGSFTHVYIQWFLKHGTTILSSSTSVSSCEWLAEVTLAQVGATVSIEEQLRRGVIAPTCGVHCGTGHRN